MTTELTVTVADLQAARMCSRGARQWFVRYGLDWSAFLRTGLPASVFENIDDAMGKHLVEVARARATGDDE